MADPVDIREATNNARPKARISEEVVRRSAVNLKANPYVAPSFPPTVERAVQDAGHPLLAQDQSIASTFGWAGSDPVTVAYAEGVAFLGYSYLAALAQRAEYRVVTETIASEMTREWIEIKVGSDEAQKNQIKDRIEERLEDLRARDAFRQVIESDGFFGRGHLYLNTGVTDDANELITDLGNGRNIMSRVKIGPGKNQRLIELRPVEATWVYPTFYESVDPLKRDWYNPVTFYVMSREIHRSRLLTFVGRPVPDILKPAYAFGGLSMSQMLKPYVDNWLRTRQAVSDLIQNFSHNVLRTNLDATLGIGGDQLFSRIALFNNIKNNMGCIVIDKDTEDWANVSIPVGSLDALQAQAQEHMAAISRIPLVKLLGIQPAGLNASSEGELIAFEDWIASFQEVLMRSALTTVIDLIQLSEFGAIDTDLTFDFKPLRQLKPIEEAQLNSITSQTRNQYYEMGAVDAAEIRETLAEDKDAPFQGLDLKKPLPTPPGPPGIPPMGGPSGPPQPPGGGAPKSAGGSGGGQQKKPQSFLPKVPTPNSEGGGLGKTDAGNNDGNTDSMPDALPANASIPAMPAMPMADMDAITKTLLGSDAAPPEGAPAGGVAGYEGGQFVPRESRGGAAAKIGKQPEKKDWVNLPGHGKPVEKPRLQGSKGHIALISSREPTAVQSTGIRQNYNRVDLDSMRTDTESFEHNIDLLRDGRFYTGLRPEETEGKSAEEVADAAKRLAVSNLRFLYDNAPEELKKQGHLWYEGAHNIAQKAATDYGIPLASAAGVYAALSPQKLWDMNVYLGDRLLEIYHTKQNEPWSNKMQRAANEKIQKAGLGKTAATPEEKARKIAEAQKEMRALVGLVQGKRLNQLTSPADKALWITLHDEAEGKMQFDRLSPEGNRLGTYVRKDGSPQKAVWQTITMTTNAIMALESNGDREVISDAMGEKHKVRSFYNNILDPDSDNDDVTMDTHAIGAALLRVLGGTDVPVAHSLGTNPKAGKKPEGWVAASTSSVTGLSGTYGLWADAYRDLAKELKIKPRVLQSITWEAKRRLFDSDTARSVAPKVEEAWRDYHNGKTSLENTQKKVLALARGMTGKRPAGTKETEAQAAERKARLKAVAQAKRAAETSEETEARKAKERTQRVVRRERETTAAASSTGHDASSRNPSYARKLYQPQLDGRGTFRGGLDGGRRGSITTRATGLDKGSWGQIGLDQWREVLQRQRS